MNIIYQGLLIGYQRSVTFNFVVTPRHEQLCGRVRSSALENITNKGKLSGCNVLFHAGNIIESDFYTLFRNLIFHNFINSNAQYISHTSHTSASWSKQPNFRNFTIGGSVVQRQRSDICSSGLQIFFPEWKHFTNSVGIADPGLHVVIVAQVERELYPQILKMSTERDMYLHQICFPRFGQTIVYFLFCL